MWRLAAGIGKAVGWIGEKAAASSIGSKWLAKDMTKFHKGALFGPVWGVAWAFLGARQYHDPAERRKSLVTNLGIVALTMGHRSVLTQQLMSWGLLAAAESPQLGRGIVQGLRTGLQNRTMAAVPFSMTQVNMQQAYASMEYARNRMGSAYSTIGNEAAMFSARYLTR